MIRFKYELLLKLMLVPNIRIDLILLKLLLKTILEGFSDFVPVLIDGYDIGKRKLFWLTASYVFIVHIIKQ